MEIFRVSTGDVRVSRTLRAVFVRSPSIFKDFQSVYLKKEGSVKLCINSGVPRAQPMPGHSMGTLRLRVASYLGPAQLSAACSTEMQKQLGGSGGDTPPEHFGIF